MENKTKHAYLVMAHGNFEILKILLSLIDDARNDIYLHIDEKVKIFDEREFLSVVKQASLFFIERRDVKWAHVSQVKLEFDLFKAAHNHGGYSYYHILSGVDLPLKTQDDIHHFFEDNAGYEFVGFDTVEGHEDRVDKIHLFDKYYRIKNPILHYFFLIVRVGFIKMQQCVGYHYFPQNIQMAKGGNWVSVTDHFVTYLLKQEEETLERYKYTNSPDEFFLQVILRNSSFYDKVYHLGTKDSSESCMRHIDWKRGGPYTFTTEDFDELVGSKFLFARKFDEKVDFEIVKRIFHYLKG